MDETCPVNIETVFLFRKMPGPSIFVVSRSWGSVVLEGYPGQKIYLFISPGSNQRSFHAPLTFFLIAAAGL